MKLFIFFFFLVLNSYSQSTKSDVERLIEKMGLDQHIKVTRDVNTMWVTPSQEVDYLIYFDGTIDDFKGSVSEYYLSNYSEKEISEILDFYSTPLGKKITENTKLFLESGLLAEEKWDEFCLDTVYKYIYR